MIFLGLLVLGFFFPLAWLALVAYTIYYFATHQKRRAAIIKGYVSQMVARGLTEMEVPNLYFESALGFAKANGASIPEWEKPDVVWSRFELHGHRISATFARMPNGGTEISLD